jgi:hypothetical protein
MLSITGHTTGKETSSEMIMCVNDKLGYDFTNLVAIFTGGAHAICGKNGAVALLEEFIGRQITFHHCIIQLQVLFVLTFERVISVVVSIVNFLRSTGQ